MNRIYQGKVTDEQPAIGEWLSYIGHSPQAQRHHKLFQDAVKLMLC